MGLGERVSSLTWDFGNLWFADLELQGPQPHAASSFCARPAAGRRLLGDASPLQRGRDTRVRAPRAHPEVAVTRGGSKLGTPRRSPRPRGAPGGDRAASSGRERGGPSAGRAPAPSPRSPPLPPPRTQPRPGPSDRIHPGRQGPTRTQDPGPPPSLPASEERRPLAPREERPGRQDVPRRPAPAATARPGPRAEERAPSRARRSRAAAACSLGGLRRAGRSFVPLRAPSSPARQVREAAAAGPARAAFLKVDLKCGQERAGPARLRPAATPLLPQTFRHRPAEAGRPAPRGRPRALPCRPGQVRGARGGRARAVELEVPGAPPGREGGQQALRPSRPGAGFPRGRP